MMKRNCLGSCIPLLMFFFLTGAFFAEAQQPVTPVAQWDLSEGQGLHTVETISGTDGTIHGATWVEREDGFALRFDGLDDYVDGGEVSLVEPREALTLEVWVYPDQPDHPDRGEPGIFGTWFSSYALTFYRGSCWFYIGSGANKVHVPLPVGEWTHIVATFDGTDLCLYSNGQKPVRNKSTFNTVPQSDHVYLGAIVPNAAATPSVGFPGMIASARLYDRALTWKEIAKRYNTEANRYGHEPIATKKFDTLGLQIFPYPERGEIVARVDYTNVTLPLDRMTVRVEILGTQNTYKTLSLTSPTSITYERRRRARTQDTHKTISLTEERDTVEVTLNPPTNAPPSFQCRAALLLDGTMVATTDVEVPWHTTETPVPRVADYRVPPLPPRIVPPSFTARLGVNGSIALKIGDEAYRVFSRFSYPQGGFNTLGDNGSASEVSETGWSVSKEGDRFVGRGAYYRIIRKLVRTPTRIEVVDTIENTTDDIIGVLLEHHLGGPQNAHPTLNSNPTVFLAGKAYGVGIVALDDIFFLRAENRLEDGFPVLSDKHLGIPPKGSHTIRWAIYPTATTDYYDFINQVRRDEKINGYVPGSFAFTTSWDPPTPDYVKNRRLAFYSWTSITRVLRNPTISLEGWEFTDYPALCDKIRTWISQCRAAYPNLETTFHVAHSLFATNEPKALFPDSLAIDSAGNALCYGGNSTDYYNKYFSPELVRDGWRWWLYYPTMENSYGRRMLDAADYMIHDLGATSVWADGYISGYIRPGSFTYDHWDGVSVSIDPETKMVTAKKALVPYVAMPVLKAVAQKYTDAGGYLITNGKPGPFSFTRLPVISSCETSGGDQQPISQLHLGSTVTPLGAPNAIKTFQDVYDDILRKLDHGALYFWYGEGDTVTEPTIVSEMYPITFESIHPGIVRGKERIVTKVSGVYGWPGSRDLHQVHFYDGRGRKRPHAFVTTVDGDSVRTKVILKAGESAVIERLPVQLQSQTPQNVLVHDFEAGRLSITTSSLPGEVQEIVLSAVTVGSMLQLSSGGRLKVVE